MAAADEYWQAADIIKAANADSSAGEAAESSDPVSTATVSSSSMVESSASTVPTTESAAPVDVVTVLYTQTVYV